MIVKLLVEQFLRIELQPRWKETCGKHLGKIGQEGQKIFDQVFSYSRLFNSFGIIAYKPILIHPILMSIIFEHYKQLDI